MTALAYILVCLALPIGVYAGFALTKENDMFEVTFYTDSADEHRWRARAANGEIVATSSEGYVNYADAHNIAVKLFEGAVNVEIVRPEFG